MKHQQWVKLQVLAPKFISKPATKIQFYILDQIMSSFHNMVEDFRSLCMQLSCLKRKDRNRLKLMK